MAEQPEIAAAIRVCERYIPQIGQRILNYTHSALDIDDIEMLSANSGCSSALREPLDDETKQKCLMEGHVCTPWLQYLKWPYFQALGKVGRKYRISLSLDEILQDFESRLRSYTAWYSRRDHAKKEQTQKWCSAVLAKCRVNVEQALIQNLRPDGYDGLNKQFEEAQKILTFVP